MLTGQLRSQLRLGSLVRCLDPARCLSYRQVCGVYYLTIHSLQQLGYHPSQRRNSTDTRESGREGLEPGLCGSRVRGLRSMV